MFNLQGRKIALLERRHSDELVTLVCRLGGMAVTTPALDEVACHDDFNAFFEGLAERRFSIAIFLSGAGTVGLLAEAARREHLAETVGALRQLIIVSRGAKPVAALRRYGLKPQITTAPPHTTAELIHALSCVNVRNRGIVLVHYGERNLAIGDHLRRHGARLKEICPYDWMLPEDLRPITTLIHDLIAEQFDAVLFTNEVQCRHLFQVAAELRQAEGLALSLNQRVVVGAVGPVCARALQKMGVVPDVVPGASTMPSLVNAVAQYLESRDQSQAFSPESRSRT